MNEWIYVTDRLPKKSGCYLCLMMEGSIMRRVQIGEFFHESRTWQFLPGNVIAWQPLPDVPEAK